MSGNRRDPAQRARDQRVIAREYLMGKKQSEIAEMLGLHQTTISNELKHIQKEWLEASLVDFNEMKCRELARIDRLEVTYWEAWDASKKPTIDTLQYTDTQEDELVAGKATVRTVENKGDPRFLAGVQWCIDRRIKLFGLDDPQTFRVVDEDFDYEKWVADKDKRIASAIRLLTQREGTDGDPIPEPES